MATSYPGGIDSFNNPGPTDFEDDSDVYHDEQHSDANDAIEAIESELGPNPSGDYSTVGEAIANAKPPEVPWTPYGTPDWDDEFDDGVLDAGWTKVFPTSQDFTTWTEGAGVLSAKHSGTTTQDYLEALLTPASAFSAGDAIQTRLLHTGPSGVNYSMAGLILSTTNTWGTGTQIYTMNWITTTHGTMSNNIRTKTNFSVAGTSSTSIVLSSGVAWHLRLVRVDSTTWRTDLSADGVSWLNGYTVTSAEEPAYMGLWLGSWGQATKFNTTFDYFRRYSGVS